MILPVIMAGGTGSRLWPLSRELYPKQFLKLVGSNSLLQATIERLNEVAHQAPLLICNEEHRFIVAEQLRQANQSFSGIILEPVGRNTAPAIALAALHAIQSGDDPILLVLAADHVIQDVSLFHHAIIQATQAAKEGHLVTFGVVPTQPETGYGYIKAQQDDVLVKKILAFVEKPDLEVAKQYLASGNYYWNSGMFMFRASRYLEELKHHQPTIYAHCLKAMENSVASMDFLRIERDAFYTCPSDSIDYAVMEKTDRAVMVPLNAGWSDIGSWSAIWDVFEKDDQGNVHQGDVIDVNSKNCYVRADAKLVATIGLENLVVVDTKDAVLIAAKDQVQEVKKVVEQLKRMGRAEANLHKEVYRPWGKFDSIDQGLRYQVKRITVKPGEKLSLQMHHHRAEHWVVVSGTARVTQGEKTFLLTEDQSTYIPVGVVHALENPGKVPLEIIEIQSGAYLGEDDIVRFDDRYGRLQMTKVAKEPELA